MKKDGWRVEEETRWNGKVTAGRKDERIRKSGEDARESMMERDARDDGKGKGEGKRRNRSPSEVQNQRPGTGQEPCDTSQLVFMVWMFC